MSDSMTQNFDTGKYFQKSSRVLCFFSLQTISKEQCLYLQKLRKVNRAEKIKNMQGMRLYSSQRQK